MTNNNNRQATDFATLDEIKRVGLDETARPVTVADVHNADRSHRAFTADYCPLCGTARVIGGA